MTDRLSICAGCGGTALAGQLQGRLAGVEVRVVDCLNTCARPVALSFRADGKAAYLFAGVDPARQAGDIAIFAGLYAAAPDGIVADARPCGDLRLCLVGRIPA